MKAVVHYNGNVPLIGLNEKNQSTRFDAKPNVGGTEQAATPMEILLQAAAACSAFDVLNILRKKRRNVTSLTIHAEGNQAETHPRIFIKAHFRYELQSPDAQPTDLEQAIELSITKYCSVMNTLRQSGCVVTWESRISTVPLNP
jgi:putative redox protein